MPCPICGGLEAQRLAPGYFACTSVLSNLQLIPDPANVGAPTATGGPTVCGTRFRQDDAADARAAPSEL